MLMRTKGRGAGRAKAPVAGVPPASGRVPFQGGDETSRSEWSLGVASFQRGSAIRVTVPAGRNPVRRAMIEAGNCAMAWL